MTRAIGLWLSLCSGLFPGCGASADTTDVASLNGWTLTIIRDEGACILEYTSPAGTGRLSASPEPPCYFLRRGSSEPQSFSYQDVGVDQVLIIVGTPVDDTKRKRWNLPENLTCGEEMQGVLIEASAVTLSSTVLQGGVSCVSKGTDEKNFWLFAHEDD